MRQLLRRVWHRTMMVIKVTSYEATSLNGNWTQTECEGGSNKMCIIYINKTRNKYSTALFTKLNLRPSDGKAWSGRHQITKHGPRTTSIPSSNWTTGRTTPDYVIPPSLPVQYTMKKKRVYKQQRKRFGQISLSLSTQCPQKLFLFFLLKRILSCNCLWDIYYW